MNRNNLENEGYGNLYKYPWENICNGLLGVPCAKYELFHSSYYFLFLFWNPIIITEASKPVKESIYKFLYETTKLKILRTEV